MSDVITGLFENSTKASLAIINLERIGVTQDEINIVANQSYTKDDFAIDEGNKAAEGGIVGAASTGILATVVNMRTAWPMIHLTSNPVFSPFDIDKSMHSIFTNLLQISGVTTCTI